MARIVRAGEAGSEAERRNEGSTKCVRNSEKPDFCEAKSHPKNKNSKLDICPTTQIFLFFIYETKKVKQTYKIMKGQNNI